jgi:hypothetical protein
MRHALREDEHTKRRGLIFSFLNECECGTQ